jgi:hypothetical protein
MIIMSKRRFHDAVERRVCEEIKHYEECRYRDEQERERLRDKRELENRLIAVEKACGIDHPSHRCLEAVRAGF